MSADSRLQRLVSNRFLSRRRRRVSLVASFLPPHRQITICIKCETSDGHSQRSLQQLLVILISLPTPHRAAAVSSHWFWFVIMSLHLHLCCIRRARARTAHHSPRPATLYVRTQQQQPRSGIGMMTRSRVRDVPCSYVYLGVDLIPKQLHAILASSFRELCKMHRQIAR